MAEVATAHLLLQDNTRETSTEKRKKREEREEATHRQTGPTPLPRELERDARDLELQSACPLAEHNKQILQGGEKLCLSTVKGARARPCSQAHRVRQWHRSVSASRHGTSR